MQIEKHLLAFAAARECGRPNIAQGEASVVGERNPGSLERSEQAHGVGARHVPGHWARPVSITRFAGSVLPATIPRVSLRALLRYGAPLHPGLQSSARIRGLARRRKTAPGQSGGKGTTFRSTGAARTQGQIGIAREAR
jgi:hypothetical protein